VRDLDRSEEAGRGAGVGSVTSLASSKLSCSKAVSYGKSRSHTQTGRVASVIVFCMFGTSVHTSSRSDALEFLLCCAAAISFVVVAFSSAIIHDCQAQLSSCRCQGVFEETKRGMM
jgi:hypothetical protein